MLSMRIKDIDKFRFINSSSISTIKNKIVNSKGLIGSYPYTLFGKGSIGSTCPRNKHLISDKFNAFKYLSGELNPILLDLHVNANIGVLYDSRQ